MRIGYMCSTVTPSSRREFRLNDAGKLTVAPEIESIAMSGRERYRQLHRGELPSGEQLFEYLKRFNNGYWRGGEEKVSDEG